jgi:hypothetical protein
MNKGLERPPRQRRKTMKLLLRAAFLTASIGGVGTAYAGDGEGPVPNTQFTEIPNVIAQAPGQENHAYAANQHGSSYATQRRSSIVFPWSSRG